MNLFGFETEGDFLETNKNELATLIPNVDYLHYLPKMPDSLEIPTTQYSAKGKDDEIETVKNREFQRNQEIVKQRKYVSWIGTSGDLWEKVERSDIKEEEQSKSQQNNFWSNLLKLKN